MKIKTLLVGCIPPPIGGISVHMNRFLESFSKPSEIELAIFDIRKIKIFKKNCKSGFFSLFPEFFHSKIIHTHISNKLINLILAIISKIFLKKVIYTHHSSIFGNSVFLKWIFYICDKIIVVNQSSLACPEIRKYLSKIVVIPAFIKPYKFDEIDNEILNFIKNYNFIIVANGFRANMWNTINLYGFDLLIKAYNFATEKKLIDSSALVLVDPSNTSSEIVNTLLSKMPEITRNSVKFVGRQIDFSSLIKYASVVVRPTRTDGDALTIREAIYLDKPVIASNVVERPEGVITYDTEDYIDLANKLKDVFSKKIKLNKYTQPDFGMEIINLYKNILSK